MNLNKFFIFLLIGIICSVSVVSATDVNDDGFENTFDADFYYVDDSVYDDFDYDSFVDDDYEVMGKLVSDINKLHPGDVYNLKHNYFADFHRSGIDINVNNVTIDGKGHTIDGNNIASIFNVNADNVKIINLNIINSAYDNTQSIQFNKGIGSSFWQHAQVNSPVCWNGNNGVLNNCSFLNTQAVNGGALTWMGNNGLIKNVKFMNNTATGVGGSLYIGGTNNILSNLAFVNSNSKLSHETIFFDRNRNNIAVLNCSFDKRGIMARDGKQLDFDASNLYNYVHSPVFGKTVDLVDCIYLSLINNNTKFVIDDSTIAYGTFANNSYALYFQKNCGDGVVLNREYIFPNVILNDDIFNALYKGSYSLNNILVKNMNVSLFGGTDSKSFTYDEVCKITANQAFANIIPIIKDLTLNHKEYKTAAVTVLNVNFLGKYDIFTHTSWNVADNSFDIVKINGHGSKIYANADLNDEYKAIRIVENKTVFISDLTIEKFNKGIENLGGYCILNNVVIKDNKMHYWFERDWGAGMLNTGYAICNNCTFSNNYAKNGGAIFSQGHLIINNCTFNNNKAYGKGNDVCIGDGGTVEYNGVNILKSDVKDDNMPVTNNIIIDKPLKPFIAVPAKQIPQEAHKIIYFAESLSTKAKYIISTLTTAVALIGGAVIGFLTANPVIGAVAGAGIGAAMGALTAGYFISKTYDVNYNRVRIVFVLVSIGVAYGMQGGLFGSSLPHNPYEEADIFELDSTFNYNPDDDTAIKITPHTRIIPKCIVA